jgi:hypothetical protein
MYKNKKASRFDWLFLERKTGLGPAAQLFAAPKLSTLPPGG